MKAYCETAINLAECLKSSGQSAKGASNTKAIVEVINKPRKQPSDFHLLGQLLCPGQLAAQANKEHEGLHKQALAICKEYCGYDPRYIIKCLSTNSCITWGLFSAQNGDYHYAEVMLQAARMAHISPEICGKYLSLCLHVPEINIRQEITWLVHNHSSNIGLQMDVDVLIKSFSCFLIEAHQKGLPMPFVRESFAALGHNFKKMQDLHYILGDISYNAGDFAAAFTEYKKSYDKESLPNSHYDRFLTTSLYCKDNRVVETVLSEGRPAPHEIAGKALSAFAMTGRLPPLTLRIARHILMQSKAEVLPKKHDLKTCRQLSYSLTALNDRTITQSYFDAVIETYPKHRWLFCAYYSVILLIHGQHHQMRTLLPKSRTSQTSNTEELFYEAIAWLLSKKYTIAQLVLQQLHTVNPLFFSNLENNQTKQYWLRILSDLANDHRIQKACRTDIKPLSPVFAVYDQFVGNWLSLPSASKQIDLPSFALPNEIKKEDDKCSTG